ncbi:tetratricopeptide repeat protein [Simiduia agarivorans]|uniref:Uncharacterized protein n=1 Tax=Simiduia agarivorans (strain DSM 21679 / JCM 13881 / BCRC 17597 / SA1) TaxID=1117647 RepID=K4KII6_SIMAS|nr:tetratricopeptide repeat protein [Simiduia agarivorans]AFU98964.1 hypothetical protein M5M_08885 [Simiduia agarivorans SA1 = DSM 21679]
MINRLTFAALCIAVLFFGAVGCASDKESQQDKAERHLKSAQSYYRQGQYRAAMLEARNVIQQGERLVPAYELLANVYNQVGAFRQTQRIPEEVVAQSDFLAIALAEAYVASKKYRSAIEVLNTIVLSPDTEKGLRYFKVKGEALLYLNDYAGLEQHIKELGKVSGKETLSLRGYLEAAYQLAGNNPLAAKELLDGVIESHPDYFPALTLRGDIALYFNEREAAERYYTEALATLKSADVLTAERATVLGRLIETLTQLGRATEAYTYQKILSEANPEGISAQQRFAEALERFSSGDLEGASKILQELHDQFPEDQNAGTLLGVVSQKLGNFDRADELFGQYVDAETVTPEVIQAATIAKLSTQQPDAALSMLQRACELQPENAAIWATYGLALAELKSDPKDVVRALERSLALKPEQARLRIALAAAYNQSGKEQQARAQLSKAYDLAKTDLLVQQAYYRLLAAVGEVDLLEQLINEFMKSHPELPQGYFFSGWYLNSQGELKKAEAAFERALSMDDKKVASITYAALAEVHEKMGEPVKVTQDWENAMVAMPAALFAYERWVVSLYRRNIIDTAEARLASLKIPDEYWQPEYTLANLALRQKDYDKVLQLSEIVLEKRPGFERAHALAAEAYQQKAFQAYANGDLNLAKKHFLNAAAEMPRHMGYLANLVKLELDAGNAASAQSMLDQFNAGQGDQATRAYLQGKIFEHQKKLPDALMAYRTSWDHAPSDLAGQALFVMLRQANELTKAALFLDEWHSGLPDSAQPLVYKAMNAQAEKDESGAKAYYLKALEINKAQPVVLNNLAWIVQKDSIEEALKLARRAYDLAPSSPAIIDTLGWFMVEAGEVQEGVKLLEQASRLAPDNAEIATHLERARSRL